MNNPIKDSGSRTVFSTGANRDCKDENGRTDLMPNAVVARLINMADENTPFLEVRASITRDNFLSYLDDFVYNGNDEAMIQAMHDFIIRNDIFVKEYETLAKQLECEIDLENVTARQLVSAAMIPLSMHFRNGTIKYGERNWEKGMPLHSYVDSGIRHYHKVNAALNDEPHHLAVLWNLMCGVWTKERLPKMNDLPFAKKLTAK